MFLALGFAKGTSSLHREMEKGPMCKIAWGEENIAITMNIAARSLMIIVHTMRFVGKREFQENHKKMVCHKG